MFQSTPESVKAQFRAKYEAERTKRNVEWGYCFCGCGQLAPVSRHSNAARGYVAGEPRRFIQGHNRRLLSTYYRISNTGCWMWEGSKLRARGGDNYYGVIGIKNSRKLAHVALYEYEHGPVPEGKILHHVCVERGFGDTLCVNPEHLEPVTYAENSRRGKPAKLTTQQVGKIKHLLNASELKYKEIAAIFDVTYGCIADIATNRTWRGV